MKPGPAFIFDFDDVIQHTGQHYGRRYYDVPAGYIWQPGTESTGAGWVRPHGPPLREQDNSECRP